MTWKIRHEGSPRSVEGLTAEQVVEGLQDGLWEPTDEVMGPKDSQWLAIESHPQLADVAADIEAPPPKVEDDETRLDMNPLIDVALVLLIFFILTTSYAALQRVMEMPRTATDPAGGPVVVSKERVDRFTIRVELKNQENGNPVYVVEDKPVPEEELVSALSQWVRDTKKTEIAIKNSGVKWGVIVTVLDAAKTAGIQRGHLVVNPPHK